jgi:hypothetical protein
MTVEAAVSAATLSLDAGFLRQRFDGEFAARIQRSAVDEPVHGVSDCPSISSRTSENPTRCGYTAALALNLLLNAGWSWLFFNRRKLGASAVAAAALTASSADLKRRAVEVRLNRGAPLVPYPLWCAFATLLSARIWMLNRCRSD